MILKQCYLQPLDQPVSARFVLQAVIKTEVHGIEGGARYLPASSPHLNTTENLWTNLKFDIYRGGRQNSSLNSILEAEISTSENSDCVETRMRTDLLAGRPIAAEKRADQNHIG